MMGNSLFHHWNRRARRGTLFTELASSVAFAIIARGATPLPALLSIILPPTAVDLAGVDLRYAGEALVLLCLA